VTEGKDPPRARKASKSATAGTPTARGAGKSESRKRLGDNLRRMYDEVVNEPVPQEMLDLLARLSDGSRKNGS
jgi:hypothetical protein